MSPSEGLITVSYHCVGSRVQNRVQLVVTRTITNVYPVRLASIKTWTPASSASNALTDVIRPSRQHATSANANVRILYLIRRIF